ncbi:MAG: hypothetical protein IJR88_00405 [Clostridia bacterium]|nr:hypothetical protein [Clostridia bacterium]
MFIIELCGIPIRLENRYSYVERLCKNFRSSRRDYAFSVSATEEEIAQEMQNGNFPPDYCESICLYRHICEILPGYHIFIMHSSVVMVDGVAYAFAAKSGVGKSTHTALWIKAIPGATVLNGDKPLLRMNADGSVTAFGTPWCGKEGWGINSSAPLGAICFLERGTENKIRRATEEEVLSKIAHQLYLRGTRTTIDLQLQLLNRLVSALPYYVLSCTISEEAAKLAYTTMKRNKEEFSK